jgi:DNA-binding NarL/FixJ family response regulator
MKRPRILLADDHKIVTEGLKGLLEPCLARCRGETAA